MTDEDEHERPFQTEGLSDRAALAEAKAEIALLKAELMIARRRLGAALSEQESARAQRAPTIRPGKPTDQPMETLQPQSGERVRAFHIGELKDRVSRVKKQG